MKWHYCIVRCEHVVYCGNKQYPAYKIYVDNDEYLIPCNIEKLTTQHIINMEEWAINDNGYIIQDSKTNLIGVYCL